MPYDKIRFLVGREGWLRISSATFDCFYYSLAVCEKSGRTLISSTLGTTRQPSGVPASPKACILKWSPNKERKLKFETEYETPASYSSSTYRSFRIEWRIYGTCY